MPLPSGTSSANLLRRNPDEVSVEVKVIGGAISIEIDGPAGYYPLQQWDDMKDLADFMKDKLEAFLGSPQVWTEYGSVQGSLGVNPWTA